MWPRSEGNRRSRGSDNEDASGNTDTIDLRDPQQRSETRPRRWDLLATVALGGVAGSEARYGLGELIPRARAQFPWSTLIVNVSGCLLIGALMAVLLELTGPHRLMRPLLGVGVLGGYTTFSTFAVDAETLVHEHEPLLALAYVAATVVLCLLAVVASTMATQLVGRRILQADVRQRRPEGKR